jgi:hypothetical protein
MIRPPWVVSSSGAAPSSLSAFFAERDRSAGRPPRRVGRFVAARHEMLLRCLMKTPCGQKRSYAAIPAFSLMVSISFDASAFVRSPSGLLAQRLETRLPRARFV